MLKTEEATPIFRQYLSVKEQHKDKLLLFQLGDFYELYGDDAAVASKVLNILLTKRSYRNSDSIPMAGFPVHALDNYLPKLVRAGHKVAVCDQVKATDDPKGLVKRTITRIVSVGTAIEELISDYDYPKLMAVCINDNTCDTAIIDKIKGIMLTSSMEIRDLESSIFSHGPSEIILPRGQDLPVRVTGTKVEHTNIETRDPRELALGYLKQLEPASEQKLTIQKEDKGSFVLDGFTASGLEVFETQSGESNEGTLLWAIDETVTCMGKRLLKEWLRRPLLDVAAITNRHDSVEKFAGGKSELESLRSELKQINDLDRFTAKIINNRLTPKELLALKLSLKQSLKIECAHVSFENTSRDKIMRLVNILESFISEDAPATVSEGNFVKKGYNAELDSFVELDDKFTKQLDMIEKTERARTGITNLKIGYNDIFGYFLEVTKGNRSRVPDNYIRVQTLKNAERYTTKEIQELQNRIKESKDRRRQIELREYGKIMEILHEHLGDIRITSHSIAEIDVLSSFAWLAIHRKYVRPKINAVGKSIILKDSRHPILDKVFGGKFIANDIEITEDRNFHLITGPNMAGKSTYIRQVAHIVLLAQAGCFVPCSYAEITPVDSVFSRIGSSDRLYKGESTFMVEMKEVAHILQKATPKSLIILDEVGRGTSTYDGLSIAWALCEYIHDRLNSTTLFATHYSELVKLSEKLNRLNVMKAKISEWKGEIVYLYKFENGIAEKSYGIHVAKLAKLPDEVIENSKCVLARLEKLSKDRGFTVSKAALLAKEEELFTLVSTQELEKSREFIRQIAGLNTDDMTPMQALGTLAGLVDKARGHSL